MNMNPIPAAVFCAALAVPALSATETAPRDTAAELQQTTLQVMGKAVDLTQRICTLLEGVHDQATADAAVTPELLALIAAKNQLADVLIGLMMDNRKALAGLDEQVKETFTPAMDAAVKMMKGLKKNKFYGSTALKKALKGQGEGFIPKPEGVTEEQCAALRKHLEERAALMDAIADGESPDRRKAVDQICETIPKMHALPMDGIAERHQATLKKLQASGDTLCAELTQAAQELDAGTLTPDQFKEVWYGAIARGILLQVDILSEDPFFAVLNQAILNSVPCPPTQVKKGE